MLLSLPQELVAKTLLQLDIPGIKNCKLVNKELKGIIDASTVIRYLFACEAAGVIDNPHTKASYAERLATLEKHEEAWASLCPTFTSTIRVEHPSSGIYDLTGGICLLGDDNAQDLHYCALPSTQDDEVKWRKMKVCGPASDRETHPGSIVDMGMAVYEHDLIVNVVSYPTSQIDDDPRSALDLVFLKFSTGEYHPLAEQHRIHVCKSASSQPSVALEIVGDNIALVLTSRGGEMDILFIFNWKTGKKKLEHYNPESSYSSLTFASPEILIVPNLHLADLEIWRIPPDSNQSPRQILGLHIPRPSRNHVFTSISCRGEPNPFKHNTPYAPPKPFYNQNPIIIFNVRVIPITSLLDYIFTLILHRQALLDVIAKFTSMTLPLPFKVLYFNNEVNHAPNPPHGPRRAPSGFAHMSFAPAPTKLSEGGVETYCGAMIPWAEWGPPISWWFEPDFVSTRWITTTTGQRWVSLVWDSDEDVSAIIVADFNPHNIRRELAGVKRHVQKGIKRLEHHGMFDEEINMALPHSISAMSGRWKFGGVLMDEERLLGLKTGEAGHIEKITVFYFG
ncbi:hypothetical protein AX17_006850 [Amanita inopinata Kibby_2008]|nr:hypothetical protein AX17_006850 [Amanita inopinata Kibby_2008]